MGAPKRAMRPSPITEITMPPNSDTTPPARLMQRSTNARTSSGSIRSDSVVKPDKSANRTVAQRRSSMVGGAAGEADSFPESGWPQLPQNLNPGGLSCPQFEQARASSKPQLPQNL